jgi:catechol 2,3-dioxygenase-like lactoylglutathione lyase family enzyme
VTLESSWPGPLFAITLFVEDLDVAKRFYGEIFALPVAYEDANSAVFKFADTVVNLLKVSEAPGLIAPAAIGSASDGARFQFTLHVKDVDARCEQLRAQGVELLNGPLDRPWGVRTACFKDPAGHIWEIAQPTG